MARTLYVCDLDGTLLGPDATVSEFSRAGLRHLLAHGVRLTVATARSAPAVDHLLSGLCLADPIIELNGAFVTDVRSGRHLASSVLEGEAAVAAVRAVRSQGYEPVLTTFDGTRDSVYFGPDLDSGTEWYVREKLAYGDPRLRPTDDLGRVAVQEAVASVCFFAATGVAERVADALRAELADTVLVACAPNHYLPGLSELLVSHPEADKGHALSVLRASHLEAGTRVVAFGDHLNDLPMFAAADLCVAPANAQPAVLARADHVVGANGDDGVVRYLLQEHGMEANRC